MPVANDFGVHHRPCLVLAHTDAVYAADACRRFRRLGWDVYLTQGGPEARRLARMLEADLVVLDVDLHGESGFLTCAKLTRERPGGKVVLVCEDADPRIGQMAVFVGAAAVVGRDSLRRADWPFGPDADLGRRLSRGHSTSKMHSISTARLPGSAAMPTALLRRRRRPRRRPRPSARKTR